MRKKPTFRETVICEDCKAVVEKTGPRQKLCKDCAKIRSTASKRVYEEKTHPSRKFRPDNVNQQQCKACGVSAVSNYDGEPYCNKHWLRLFNNGTIELACRKSTNKYEVDGNVLLISTKNGVEIIADADDYDLLKKHSWCISKTGYAVANINQHVVKMHHFIVGLDNCEGFIVDHKDGFKLNNSRSNLRICTSADNARNKSVSENSLGGLAGIRKTKNGTFSVRITVDRKEVYIGTFDSLERAVEARIYAENKYHGEYGTSSRINGEWHDFCSMD